MGEIMLYRYFLKKKITNNLGKVIEENDKLICYVNRKKCKSNKKEYNIICINRLDRDIIDKYGLDKDIYYVFDDLDFNKKVNIIGDEKSHISINNSKFDYGLSIYTDGRCSLDRTFIRAYNLFVVHAYDLEIKDMNICNVMSALNYNLIVNLEVDKKLDVINSSIGQLKTNTKIMISSEKFSALNSKISADNVLIDSNNILFDNSVIIGNREVELINNKFKNVDVKSSNIIYNKNKINKSSEIVSLSDMLDLSVVKKVELIDFLKKVKQECNTCNNCVDFKVLKKSRY